MYLLSIYYTNIVSETLLKKKKSVFHLRYQQLIYSYCDKIYICIRLKRIQQ